MTTLADLGGSAEPPRVAAKRRPARPIALYLFVLALVALVPAFVFSAILLQRNNEAQERVVESLITGTARSIVQAVDREISANVTTLRVLATTPELLAGDLASFHARVRSAFQGSGSHIYVLNEDFRTVMSTRAAFNPEPGALATDAETARRALENRDIAISGPVLGVVSRQWVINILLPIYPTTGRPAVLALSREASQLAGTLLANKMPEGWDVALVADDGKVIASTTEDQAIGSQFRRATVSEISGGLGWRAISSPDGDNLFVAQKSLLTGWSLVAWAPRDVVAQPLANAFWSLLLGGALLAVLVILVIYWVSLQIGRSVHGLQADARRLGSGQPVEARSFPIAEIETVSEALGEASRRRQAAEIEVRFLMRELAHRSKNQMTVIAAMAKQTARGADSVPEFVSSFEKRIFGLARSTDLLLAHGVAGVDLRQLFVGQIDPFSAVDGDRVVVEGPALRINAQAAQIVGMAAHELATNAVKYGAFAREGGKLRVTWRREGNSIAFNWRESGVRLGTAVHRRGFGTTVLESMVGRSLGAEVTRVVNEDGLEWRFTIPLESLDPSETLNGRNSGEPPAAEK